MELYRIFETQFAKTILEENGLLEAAYKGNIGIMEISKFYQIANEKQKAKFKRLLEANKNKEAWDLIEEVVGVKLEK